MAQSDSSGLQRRSLYRAYIASLSGTSLEWYDFAVYSSSAALIFGKLFFPAGDTLTSTLQAFATFALGYISRPLGGIFFGRLGDVVGRKKVLVSTLLLVGIATVVIGLLPTYAQAGVFAPAMLVLLRFAQGVGIGGEWGGAVLLSSEFGEARQRGFWASAAQVGPPVGTLMANGVLGILTASLSEDAFIAWGWRLAFLLSAVLVIFGLWIRARIEETPVFRALEARGITPRSPVGEVFRLHGRGLAAVILARIGSDVLYAMFAVFVLTYATHTLGLSRGQAVTAVMIGSALQVIGIPFSGWLSDRYGRRLVYAIGAITGAFWSVAFFAFAQGLVGLLVGVIVGLIFHSLMYGTQAAFIAEQFHVRLRSTGCALGYTLASIVGGGIAPLIFTYVLAKTGSGQLIGLYIFATCMITLVGLALGRAVDDTLDEFSGDERAGRPP